MNDDVVYSAPSKSEQKRALERWRERTELLIVLPQKEIDALDLPEELCVELREGKRLTDRAARSRHISYLTRLVAQSSDEVKLRLMTRFAPTRRNQKKAVKPE